jgi:hypothetical protein
MATLPQFSFEERWQLRTVLIDGFEEASRKERRLIKETVASLVGGFTTGSELIPLDTIPSAQQELVASSLAQIIVADLTSVEAA